MIILINLAGIPVRIRLRYSETAKDFPEYVVLPEESDWDIYVSEEDILSYAFEYPYGCLQPYQEHYMLMAKASSYLLSFHRVLFHGVAFLWRNQAWILTAPSGTGKTTQYHLWNNILGGQIELINGDKPLLEVKQDKSIWVHPSPWTGKEQETGIASGKLAGIIVLAQAGKNRIRKISPEESVFLLYQQLLVLNDNEKEIYQCGEIIKSIVKELPIWYLENLGDVDSAQLTIDTLSEYEGKHDETV